jgi:hypothetical protein
MEKRFIGRPCKGEGKQRKKFTLPLAFDHMQAIQRVSDD